MPWVYLDDGFSENRKVLAVGGDAAWLFVCGLCFCNRTLTDGRIPKAIVGRLSDRKNPGRLASKLVDVGLWHDRGDHYEVHDYSDYQPTAESVRAKREQARRAAQSRWGPKPRSPSDPHSGVHANRIAERSAESNAETMPRTRVSQSPPSPNPSSSPLPPSEEEDGFPREAIEAARMEARRRMETTTTEIVNPTAYVRAVTDALLDERACDLLAWVGAGQSASEMAARLRPTNGTAGQRPPGHVPFGESEPVWVEERDENGNLVARRAR